MAKVQGTTIVNVEIDMKQAIKALAIELEIDRYFTNDKYNYYKVEDNKIYKYINTSTHGSDNYKKELEQDNAKISRNYQLIKEIADLNNIQLNIL